MSTIDEIMEMIHRWEDAADDHLDGALFLTIKSAIDTKDAEIERLRARLAEINALYGVPAITLSTICALPLPTGPRQAVLLTDEQIERAVDGMKITAPKHRGDGASAEPLDGNSRSVTVYRKDKAEQMRVAIVLCAAAVGERMLEGGA